jgi:hypothetical protein
LERRSKKPCRSGRVFYFKLPKISVRFQENDKILLYLCITFSAYFYRCGKLILHLPFFNPIMKKLLAFFFLFVFADSFAQPLHSIELDDGAGHYSVIKGSATGGTYTLPSGSGTIMTASTLSFADFYALMPGDNAATIAVGTAVQFPNNGPSDGSGAISRSNASVFTLSAAGTYEVFFQVSVSEAGQLMLRLNGAEVANSVVGRATGTSQLTSSSIITVSANSTLEVVNPSGNATALTITPVAGGTHSVSAHLVIKRLQ